ncbi:MAG: hypothetical protein GXX96_14120 [Planctomycetaceae bacterium]|nr:hypothetical protein [Planctomycetaceae bacterium]
MFIVAMRYSPFEALEIDNTQLARVFQEEASFRRLALTLAKPTMPVSGGLDFADKNPDHLRIEIGRLTENGLEQSWLTARTEDLQALSLWKRIANRLRKRTRSGVMAVNRETGVSVPMRSFRYSPGAKALEVDGVAMLPPQGANGPRLTLGDA